LPIGDALDYHLPIVMEKLIVLKKIGIAVLLAALSGVASANDSCKTEQFLWFSFEVCKPVEHIHSSPATAPEIDPGSAMAALTMMMGGLAVLRSRRSKTPAT
jgi:hypothetical protein